MNIQIKTNTYPKQTKKAVKIPFNGHRLYSLNLLKTLPDGSKEKIPAYFTELKDLNDIITLEKIEELWDKEARLGKKIINNFKEAYYFKNIGHDLKYFIIECPHFKNAQEKIRAMAEITKNPLGLTIEYLQSASQIKSINNIKGAGSSLIRGLCAYAKDKNIPIIDLISANITAPWYEKLGFQRSISPRVPAFELTKMDYNTFISKFEPQYGKMLEVKNEN